MPIASSSARLANFGRRELLALPTGQAVLGAGLVLAAAFMLGACSEGSAPVEPPPQESRDRDPPDLSPPRDPPHRSTESPRPLHPPAITGLVTDTARAPRPDHPVSLYDERRLTPTRREPLTTSRTDSGGRFAFEELEAGVRFIVWVQPTERYEGERQAIEAREGVSRSLTFRLLERHLSVAGRVLTVDSHMPVEGVEVSVPLHAALTRRSDGSGHFSIPHLAARAYRLRLEHPSIPAGFEIYPVQGGASDILVTLPEPGEPADPVSHPDNAKDLTGRAAPPLAVQSWLGPHPASFPSRGQPTWLRFLASWHGPSARDLAALQQIGEQTPRGLIILVHHAGGWPGGLERWRTDQGISLPLALDRPSRHAALGSLTLARYGVTTFPVDVLIDAAGVVRRVVGPHIPGKSSPKDRLELLRTAWARLTND